MIEEIYLVMLMVFETKKFKTTLMFIEKNLNLNVI